MISHYIPLCSIIFHYIPLHYIPLYSIISHYIPLYSIIFHYIPLHSIICHYIPLSSSIFHYVPLYPNNSQYIPIIFPSNHPLYSHYIPHFWVNPQPSTIKAPQSPSLVAGCCTTWRHSCHSINTSTRKPSFWVAVPSANQPWQSPVL